MYLSYVLHIALRKIYYKKEDSRSKNYWLNWVWGKKIIREKNRLYYR